MNTTLFLLAGQGPAPVLFICVGVLIAAGLVFGAVWLRHHLARRKVTTRFAAFKEHVIRLRERVEAIKERHQLLPAKNQDVQDAMTGETLALYQTIQQVVSHLWDDWLQRMDLWDKVQVLVQSERFPGVSRLKEADRLLDQLGAWDEVDQACQRSTAQLDQLERGHEQAQQLLGEAEEKPGQLRPQLESVARLPLPIAPYETELTACAALTEQARGLVRSDPIGAQSVLGTCLRRLADLAECLPQVVKLFQQAQQARNTFDQIACLAADQRAHGLLLTEPEGNPDPLLDQGRTRRETLLQALERGEAKVAAEHLEHALAFADQAKTAIERQMAAREQCARDLPARRAEAQCVQQALGTAQTQRSELERSFAPESWQTVADNLTRAGEWQSSADRLSAEAASAAAETVQHYLRASSLLDRVRQQQERIHAQLLAIGQCLQKLTDLRQECLRRRQEVLHLDSRVQEFFGQHAPAVRQPARTRLDAAAERWRTLRGLMDSLRPNWPAIQQKLEEVRKEIDSAQQEAEEDVRSHQQFVARLQETTREAERVGQFLQQRAEDRRQANDRYRTAVETLEHVRRESVGKPADWKTLIRQVEEAAVAVKQAEDLARQDLQLAERAAAEISAAEHEVARARGFFQLGISADVTEADRLLGQARLRLTEQAYEQTIEQAGSAQQAARQSHNNAVYRAQQEQQRLDQERQRLAAAASAPGSSPLAAEAGPPNWQNPADPFQNPPPSDPATFGH